MSIWQAYAKAIFRISVALSPVWNSVILTCLKVSWHSEYFLGVIIVLRFGLDRKRLARKLWWFKIPKCPLAMTNQWELAEIETAVRYLYRQLHCFIVFCLIHISYITCFLLTNQIHKQLLTYNVYIKIWHILCLWVELQ